MEVKMKSKTDGRVAYFDSGTNKFIRWEEPSQTKFQKYGKYLPVAGSVVGGIAGGLPTAPFGGEGAIPGAFLGGAAGESVRQIIGRGLGEKSPQTPMEAVNKIGEQGVEGAIGETTGQLTGKVGGLAFKEFPKVGQMFSGTPARNLEKAQARGLFGTYFPSIAKKFSRETSGENLGRIEDSLLTKYFKPEEISKIKLRKSGFADKIVEDSLTKTIRGENLTPKEALATVKSIDVIYRDTPLGSKVAPELAQLRKTADAISARAHPEYKMAKRVSEATILKSQLSKPFRVLKTNPDVYSGFQGAIAPVVGGALGYESKSVLPMLGGMMATSPAAFGIAAGTMGSVKNVLPPLLRRGIQRTGIQDLLREFRDK